MNMLHVSFVSMIIKHIQFEYNFKKFVSFMNLSIDFNVFEGLKPTIFMTCNTEQCIYEMFICMSFDVLNHDTFLYITAFTRTANTHET